MADISDLPMVHDIDADYTPHYVKPRSKPRTSFDDIAATGEFLRAKASPPVHY
jgi:hypothetical protein